MAKRRKIPKRIPKAGFHLFTWTYSAATGVTVLRVDHCRIIGETDTHYLTDWKAH